jgi:hypothetical protein
VLTAQKAPRRDGSPGRSDPSGRRSLLRRSRITRRRCIVRSAASSRESARSLFGNGSGDQPWPRYHLDAAGKGGTAAHPRELGWHQLDSGDDCYRHQSRQVVSGAAPVFVHQAHLSVRHQHAHHHRSSAATCERPLEQ